MGRSTSTALPVAYVTLRILMVLNWIYGALILVLLLLTPNRDWIISALDLAPGPDAERTIWLLRAAATLGLVAVPINQAILGRLLKMVATVGRGDPFVRENAYRLNAIAWLMAALQVLSMVIGVIGKAISTPAHPVHLDAGFSVNGWLAVILTFVLARVFAEGALMREDLEGTV